MDIIIYNKNNIFNKAEIIIYESLKLKINIKIINEINEINKTNNYKELICYKCNYKNYRSITHLSELLYLIVSKITNDTERLLFIKNIFKNKDIIVLAPGPYLNKENIKYYVENYITISVKYVTAYLFENNMTPTFIVSNQWSTKNSLLTVDKYHEYKNKVISIYGKNQLSKPEGLINFNVLNGTHKQTFDNIAKHKDLISWVPNKLFYYKAHIMLELAIPLCKHLGVINIYTSGWDLDYKSKKKYFDNNIIITEKKINNINYIGNEKYIVKDVVLIFKKYGINIYKLEKNSPINLPHYDLIGKIS